MKILIVSGFLGAGKTTFIQTLAQRTHREIAILENEYSSLGIDGDALKRSPESEGIDIWELTEGCICCSRRGDFAQSVLTIANTVDPEYLVIEPTGVGMLSGIIRDLLRVEYERITLMAPITIVDGHSYGRYIREYGELYLDQIAAAHSIVVSKMEQAGEDERESLSQALRQHNPKARILTQHYSSIDDGWWTELLETRYDGTSLKVTEASQRPPDTFSLDGIALAAPEDLLVLLENMIRGAFGDIIRAKGCVRAGKNALRFDLADGRYAITGAGTDVPKRAVFIGNQIQRQALRTLLYAAAEDIRIGWRPRALAGHGKTLPYPKPGVVPRPR